MNNLINVPNSFLKYYRDLEKKNKLITIELELDEKIEKLFSNLSEIEKAWIIYKSLTQFIGYKKNYKEIITIFELENLKEILNNTNSEEIIIFDENLKEIGVLKPIKYKE